MIATPPDSKWKVVLSAEQTGGRVAVIEADLYRGGASPRHTHSREDELIYVLEGEVVFERDSQQIDGPAGSCLFLPRGSEHTFTIQSPRARLLVLLSPAGLEHSLGALAQPVSPSSEPQIVERMVTTAARYGVSITGPARTEAERHA